MFVHFKKVKPVHAALPSLQFNGLTIDPVEEDGVISIALTEDEYLEWINDPGLQRRYNIEPDGDGWKLALISHRVTLPDLEVLPMEDDDETQPDVLLMLDNGKALVHTYNSKMALDPQISTTYYAVAADDAMEVFFEIEATGADTELDVEYDTENLQVWVRAPREGITYGLRIVK